MSKAPEQKLGIKYWFHKQGVNHPYINLSVGAIAGLALVFGVGDWYKGSSVAKLVAEARTESRVAALTPFCVKAIMANPAAMVRIKEAGNNQSSVVREVFRADDGSEISYNLASSCVDGIEAAVKAQAAPAKPAVAPAKT